MTVITTRPVTTDTVASATPFWRLKGFPLIPVSILVFIAFVAVFADVLAPHDPQIGSLARRFKPPFWLDGGSLAYPLGTDHVGRDVLSRLIFGARVSMVSSVRSWASRFCSTTNTRSCAARKASTSSPNGKARTRR